MSLVSEIESWFNTHRDGEFEANSRSVPYSVIWPIGIADRIVLTTKPHVVSQILDGFALPPGLGMVGRYGLPNTTDVKWLTFILRKANAVFIGDLDPCDLLTFAWIRARMPIRRLLYLGINDSLLGALTLRISAKNLLPMSASETRAKSLCARAIPDLSTLVGTRCTAILEKHTKIELEALLRKKQALFGILTKK